MTVVRDSTERFSSRVDNYRRFRPSYPSEIITLLRDECGMTSATVVADIAFGTGIFTKLLLEKGNSVIGIDPNGPMRQAGEEYLAAFTKFRSIYGTAESTHLDDQSVDIITAAQAAHWFDCDKARKEFVRILKPGGWAALIWNKRNLDGSAFARDYEQVLLNYGVDYKEVRHDEKEIAIADKFFGKDGRYKAIEWGQSSDYESMKGRMLSSSYVPKPDHASYEPMLRALKRAFDKNQVEGRVPFDYTTQIFYGRLA